VFFEPITRMDRRTIASDFIDLSRCIKRTRELEQHMSIRGKKLLDIGSGYGTNLATCIADFGADGYGVEPSGVGFGQGYVASRILLAANGIDPERILNSVGESLPFADESFDIVYSANVLEHTQNPEQVLREAMRVLRPGGLLYVELPNYLSYFEGHYMVVQTTNFVETNAGMVGAPGIQTRPLIRTHTANQDQSDLVPSPDKGTESQELSGTGIAGRRQVSKTAIRSLRLRGTDSQGQHRAADQAGADGKSGQLDWPSSGGITGTLSYLYDSS